MTGVPVPLDQLSDEELQAAADQAARHDADTHLYHQLISEIRRRPPLRRVRQPHRRESPS